jgi:hypothetical protein
MILSYYAKDIMSNGFLGRSPGMLPPDVAAIKVEFRHRVSPIDSYGLP